MFNLFFPVLSSFFDPIVILATGLFGGFLSGFLGIGGGIIITPVLMEFGLHPLLAVANQLCHSIGINLVNFLMYKRKQDVDYHLSLYILIGGVLGAGCDWFILTKLGGAADRSSRMFVNVYTIVLIVLGVTMLVQSIQACRSNSGKNYSYGVMMRRWMLFLPFHKIFVRSRTEMSIIIPIFVGFVAGILVFALGGGENLLMAPIITYLIGRVSSVVTGTAALAGCLITGMVVIVYAFNYYCCDIEFVMILFTGALIGSWLGVKLSYNIKRCYVNMLASVAIFLMASRQIFKMLDDNSHHVVLERIKSSSVLLDFVNKDPILYTLMCIFLVTIAALFSEKTLQKITNLSSEGRR
jgi:uncharacterized membrane protein YfcA